MLLLKIGVNEITIEIDDSDLTYRVSARLTNTWTTFSDPFTDGNVIDNL